MQRQTKNQARPFASVIIVVKNDAGIETTLELLERQIGDVSFETIVIDASAPETLKGVKDRYPAVRWEYFDQAGKRFTITEQRNLGIELATGEIIVFIDASCEPADNWLSSLAGAIADGEDIVTGPVAPSNASNMVHYIQEHEARTYVDECTTINVALRRSVIDVVGEFDHKLDYGEDVDFFWRCIDAGYKICFEPAAAISHDYGESGEQRRRAYRYGRARAIIHAKHWRTRWYRLLRYEPHVWIYPLFILSLPLAIIFPPYLLVLLVPVVKNRSFSIITHHLIYGYGVIVGVVIAARLGMFSRMAHQKVAT